MYFQLSVGAGVNFIGRYFNERVSEWEPLIEPVVDDRSQTRRDWEITLEVRNAQKCCQQITGTPANGSSTYDMVNQACVSQQEVKKEPFFVRLWKKGGDEIGN